MPASRSSSWSPSCAALHRSASSDSDVALSHNSAPRRLLGNQAPSGKTQVAVLYSAATQPSVTAPARLSLPARQIQLRRQILLLAIGRRFPLLELPLFQLLDQAYAAPGLDDRLVLLVGARLPVRQPRGPPRLLGRHVAHVQI